MSDKDEAQRLADALEVQLAMASLARQVAERVQDDALTPVTLSVEHAAALLRRWPDGEPVAHQYLFDGYNGPVWRNDSGPWNGMQPKASRPLYTAPPDQSERIAALEAALEQARADMVRWYEAGYPYGVTASIARIDALRAIEEVRE